MREDRVSIVSGDVALAATVVLPAEASGGEPVPAAVLVSGSGPLDADATIQGVPLFRMLAHDLAHRGIASIRWSDRGTGGSTGSYRASSLEELADDARAAVDALRAVSGVDATRVGCIGHSEGTIPAIRSCIAATAGFVVLLAPPVLPCAENILLQTAAIGAADGLRAPRIAAEVALLERIFPLLRSGATVVSLEPAFADYARAVVADMPRRQRTAISDLEAFAWILFTQRMSMMDTVWFRSVIACDPRPMYRALAAPTLAVFGGRDRQTPAQENRRALEEIVNPRIDSRTYPTANHLLQEAVSGAPAEYATLPHRFVPGLVPAIADWIAAVSGSPAAD
jgi:pimeloyl-ACP methyl ester carboxylesterase